MSKKLFNKTKDVSVDTSKLLPTFEELFIADRLKNLIIRPEGLRLRKKIGYGRNLYIFIGSSGAGRDTILESCLSLRKKAMRLRRTTTRKPREYVADQDRLIFVTEYRFLKDFEKGEIVFAGRYLANQQLYGISKKEILKLRKRPQVIHMIEENFSGLTLKALFPEAKLIIILPPSLEILEDRLFSRDKSNEEAKERLAISISEIKAVLDNLDEMFKEKFVDMVVINEGFPGDTAQRIMRAARAKRKIFDDIVKLKNSILTK
jgi:guanylate kinase